MVKRIYKPISIEDFIRKIRNPLAGGQVENIFLHGFCYYFSIILKEKFPKGTILYSPSLNHFIFLYNSEIWDITGNVSDKYDYRELVIWDEWRDDILLRQRIIRDCIEMEDFDLL